MAVRTPPTPDLEELGAPERTVVVPDARRRRLSGPLRYVVWAIAVIVVIVIGLQLSGGFPESRTI